MSVNNLFCRVLITERSLLSISLVGTLIICSNLADYQLLSRWTDCQKKKKKCFGFLFGFVSGLFSSLGTKLQQNRWIHSYWQNGVYCSILILCCPSKLLCIWMLSDIVQKNSQGINTSRRGGILYNLLNLLDLRLWSGSLIWKQTMKLEWQPPAIVTQGMSKIMQS